MLFVMGQQKQAVVVVLVLVLVKEGWFSTKIRQCRDVVVAQ